MAKDWNYWLPDVMAHVPGCPKPVVRHELLRAAQEFFRESRVWVASIAPLPVASGQSDVVVTVSVSDADLVRVERAMLDGRELKPTTASALDGSCRGDWTTHQGAPTHFYQLTPGVISLYPRPSSASATGLQCRVSLSPGDTATGLSDESADLYRTTLADGALARLMRYPGKKWTNMDLSMLYGQKFSSAIATARRAAAQSFAGARIAARPKWV